MSGNRVASHKKDVDLRFKSDWNFFFASLIKKVSPYLRFFKLSLLTKIWVLLMVSKTSMTKC